IHVLRWIFRIGVVDVEILFVSEGENGQRIGNSLVVPHRDPGQRWLARADHVPSGAHQVSNVSKRGYALCSMWIPGENRLSGGGERAGDGPIVALEEMLPRIVALPERRDGEQLRILLALGPADIAGQILRTKSHAGTGEAVAPQNGIIDQREVQTRRYVERRRRLKVRNLLHIARTDQLDQARQIHLAVEVPSEAEDPDQRRSRAPVARPRVRQLELERQESGTLSRQIDIGIDAVGERSEDLSASRVITAELGVEIAAIEKQPGGPILLHESRAKSLRQFSLALPAPEIELPESIAGGVEALGEEEVVGRCPVDVRDSPSIDNDLSLA